METAHGSGNPSNDGEGYYAKEEDMMEVKGSGIGLDEGRIRRLEERFGVRLPDDYRAFMEDKNGGTPVGTWCFRFMEEAAQEATESVISYFEVIYPDETAEVDDLEAGYAALLGSGQIPRR
jgi:hypothetical protein